MERFSVKNAESAAILGYCVSLALGAVKNGDGTISYAGFYGAKSKVPKKSLDNFRKKFLTCFDGVGPARFGAQKKGRKKNE